MAKRQQAGSPRSLFFTMFLLLAGICSGQETVEKEPLEYHDGKDFLLEGTSFPDSVRVRYYDRFPGYAKEMVHPHVWYLSRCAAGLSVRFRTNSPRLGVKWEILRDRQENHMPATGIKGLDLYSLVDNEWVYINTAKPSGVENKYLLTDAAEGSMREYRLYLPLYDGLEKLEIGISPGAVIERPQQEEWSMKPIVFYGTSITQGGCASRPGMAYSNIISRKLNVECMNLGFAGNGKMEQGVARLMSEIDASMYVIDCIGNMTVAQVHQNVSPLVEILRSKHPHTPIIFVESLMFERTFMNDSLRNTVVAKNKALKQEYVELARNRDGHIYYIGVRHATGKDREGTVDGIHLNDLGFLRFSEYLIEEWNDLGVIKSK